MSKLKDLLPNIFGSDKNAQKAGRLETDAVPVSANDTNANHLETASVNSTPTTSTEIRELVRGMDEHELGESNQNSLEMVSSAMGGLVDGGMPPVAEPNMNTMNVHNAQQQLVMQISNVNKVHFGSVFNIGANSSHKGSSASCADEMGAGAAGCIDSSAKRQTPRKTTSVVAMMQSMEEPNHRMLDTIATHLGEGWKKVMRDLGHSEGQIDQALIDHQMHGGIREVIYQLLLQWVRNADENEATIGHITVLLWEANLRDCVHRMKLVWKSETKRKTSS